MIAGEPRREAGLFILTSLCEKDDGRRFLYGGSAPAVDRETAAAEGPAYWTPLLRGSSIVPKTSTKLLYHEPPRVFSPTLAKRLGINEALVLQQIHFWISVNEQKGTTQHGGFTWTYNRMDDWLKEFPWMSKRTLERVLQKLERKHKVLVGRRTPNRKWYRIDHPQLVILLGE